MSLITTPISHGELLDKITILEIKAAHIADAAKLANVRTELELLDRTWAADAAAQVDLGDARARLKAVNQKLWDIEDAIRLKERAQAQQVVSVPLNNAAYPSVTLGGGAGGGLGPYSVTQPGYGFVAPPASAGKGAGYGGLPMAHPTGLPKRNP